MRVGGLRHAAPRRPPLLPLRLPQLVDERAVLRPRALRCACGGACGCQPRCFGWPVKELRWKVGAAFATGAHVASGKEATLSALHTFFHSVQMVVVANEPPAACLLGACATNHDEKAKIPTFTDAEKADARSLATRLVVLARQMRSLIAPTTHATQPEMLHEMWHM